MFRTKESDVEPIAVRARPADRSKSEQTVDLADPDVFCL